MKQTPEINKTYLVKEDVWRDQPKKLIVKCLCNENGVYHFSVNGKKFYISSNTWDINWEIVEEVKD